MNVAEWIIVGILSGTLFIFLIVGIVLMVKLIKFTDQARKIAETGQQIADKADDIVGNVKDMTTVGSVAKNFIAQYFNDHFKKRKTTKKGGKNGNKEKE